MRAFPNPRPAGPRPRYHESSEQRSPTDSDSVARQWRRNQFHAQQGQWGVQNIHQIQRQIDRMRLRRGDGFSGFGTGLRWARPREFEYKRVVESVDIARGYKKNELVIVSPNNAAYTGGASNAIDPEAGGAIIGVDGFGADEDKAMAGLWCCVKPNKVLSSEQPPVQVPALLPNYDIHVPTWAPNMDVDATDVYWILIAFYPIEMDICIGGVPVAHYVHAQPVPQTEIVGESGEPMIGEGGESLAGEEP